MQTLKPSGAGIGASEGEGGHGQARREEDRDKGRSLYRPIPEYDVVAMDTSSVGIEPMVFTLAERARQNIFIFCSWFSGEGKCVRVRECVRVSGTVGEQGRLGSLQLFVGENFG